MEKGECKTGFLADEGCLKKIKLILYLIAILNPVAARVEEFKF